MKWSIAKFYSGAHSFAWHDQIWNVTTDVIFLLRYYWKRNIQPQQETNWLADRQDTDNLR